MDLVVDSAATKLYVSDFHISPISKNIPFTYKTDENLLKNDHLDNVKAYYKSIEGYFYNDGLDPEYKHAWPIITEENKCIDCYSNIYDMGCQRLSYNRYNKQFEFFCPVWIEHLYDDLEFKISIRSEEEPDVVLAKNSLKLNINDKPSHNKFVNYFKNYIKQIGLDTGNDNICNVNFADNHAAISGLDVSTGIIKTVDINEFVNNITLRERPLLEVDNMLIEMFKSNLLVAKQLFNFNICFNLEDILSKSIVDLISGMPLIVNVEVFIGDKILEKKDFYSEYDFIPRHSMQNSLSNNFIEKFNVLDYLKDYAALDLIDKNKFCQSTFHWSLSDNPEYIFNVYNGFSGISVREVDDEITYYENDHNYANTPDTLIRVNDFSKNTSNWINSYYLNSWKDFEKFIYHTDNYKNICSYIHTDLKYLNNLKYTKSIDCNNFYAVNLIANNKLFISILSSYKNMTKIYEDVYMIVIKDLVIFLTDHANNLSFSKFYNILNDYNKNDFADITDTEIITTDYNEAELNIIKSEKSDFSEDNYKDGTLFINYSSKLNKLNSEKADDVIVISGNENINTTKRDYLKSIYKLMSGVIAPTLITFGGSLKYFTDNGPSKQTLEVSYIKDNEISVNQNYVLRYDGNIKPTFVDNPSTLYYKDYISDNRKNGKSKLQLSVYNKYAASGFLPIYPSINFCGIKKLSNYKYAAIPMVNVSEHENAVHIIDNSTEYKWFNNSLVYSLNPNIYFECEIKSENVNEDYISEIIKKHISKQYKIQESYKIDYIISKYNINVDWDYVSDTDINTYKYKISMKLK